MRAEMQAHVATQDKPALDDNVGAALVEELAHSADRLPGYCLLLRSQAQEKPGQPGRGGSGRALDVREIGHFSGRAKTAQRRRGGCGLRQRFRGDNVQGKALRTGGYFLLVLGSRAQSSRSCAKVPGLGRT